MFVSRNTWGGSHNKRRGGIPVPTGLHPFPGKSCSVDLREVKRAVVHTVDAITGCISGRTGGRTEVAGVIPSGVSIKHPSRCPREA